jgi:hypothetical protein
MHDARTLGIVRDSNGLPKKGGKAGDPQSANRLPLDLPKHVLPGSIRRAHDAIVALYAQRDTNTLDHQRQQLLILGIEGAIDEHFETMSRVVIDSIACRNIDRTERVISPRCAKSSAVETPSA